MTGRLRVVVLGYVVRCPIGGMAWHYLQYVKGLVALGHDVFYVEDSDDYGRSCYDPTTHQQSDDPAYGLRFAAEAFDRLRLGTQWAYWDAPAGRWLGAGAERARAACDAADVFLNVSGANPVRPWLAEVEHRVFVDTDPGFEQVRQLTVERRTQRAAQHNRFFTFGENFGKPGCRIPDDGWPWQPTRQPIVLAEWPVVPAPPGAPLTSVMQWDSYESREYRGVHYGMKSKSFAEFQDLPQRVTVGLELAVGSRNAPRDELRARGWRLRDPLAVTRDPWTYQRFLQESHGEFAIAKHGYVVSRSGWFSERSAAYLASGRPVIAQDTGFGEWLTTGNGVWAVADLAGAVAAIAELDRDHAGHCVAARAIAARYFDANVVLAELLARATAGS